MSAFLARHRRGVMLTLALMTLTALAGTALLGLAGHFLTAASLAGVGALGFNLFGPSAGIRGLTFIRILSRYFEKLIGHDVTLRIGADLRTGFFRRALPLAPLQLGHLRTGELLGQLVGDIERVEGGLVRALGPLVALGTLMVVACAVMACVLPLAGLVLLLACALLGLGLPWLTARGAQAQEQARAQARAALRAEVLDGLDGATDLAALHAGATWAARIEARSAHFERLERQRKRVLALGTLGHGAASAVTLVLVLGLLLQAVGTGTLGSPAAAGLFFMTVALLEASAGAALAWRERHAAATAAQRLEGTLAPTPRVADPDTARAVPASGVLELDEVDFRWPGAAAPVLRQLRLRIAPGTRVAIGGDSGAGKSSLLALLLRLVDPDAGQLRYAGQDLRGFALADWHRHIAWLPQEAPVFAGSVRENLQLGAPEADEARLWQALAQVRLDGLVRALPGQLDGWVGEHGRTLSAGQARRLALARALLRDAPILLLDEPTEGLDVDTAQALLADLAQASAGRTVIVITHDALPAGWADAHWQLIDGRLAPRAQP
ncbi:thiol reductant ABC exporter subunit CydC [Pseudoxanthomonas winnipegensis]|jgi:ATP-binding cassette subfamily C protein CydC|uniref:Thiol reductant ABC exporter subunit CydC n=1 Tax=Pseudoxanthomonas winnipegensis TaxID=2480810 RepID=A0A4Q8LDQ8_9GAMM|nr:thiol reductant ABC exporter subunit CydC [Pseudoxanthomonas winnipegensis]TAA26720.1 thiol reductant ABC exporter subunit CydC [Pseudoxanthomonas winnipegensis]